MGPKEETVAEAMDRYRNAIRKREEEAERMRTETWRKFDREVQEAKRLVNKAHDREDRDRLLNKVFKRVADF